MKGKNGEHPETRTFAKEMAGTEEKRQGNKKGKEVAEKRNGNDAE